MHQPVSGINFQTHFVTLHTLSITHAIIITFCTIYHSVTLSFTPGSKPIGYIFTNHFEYRLLVSSRLAVNLNLFLLDQWFLTARRYA